MLFATDSAELTPEGRALLDRLAPCWSGGRFEVEGHTDSTARTPSTSRSPNAGPRPSWTTSSTSGIDASALTARGYGSSRPVADNATPEGRAQNRRVEFRKE